MSERLHGKGDGLSLRNIAEKHGVKFSLIHRNFLLGLKVEMEHTKDKLVASEIVKDHLSEIPDYYTNQHFQGLIKEEKRRTKMALKHAVKAATILAKKGYDVDVDMETGHLIVAHVDEILGEEDEGIDYENEEECEDEECEEGEEGEESVEGATKSTPATRAKARKAYKLNKKKIAKKRLARKKSGKKPSATRKKAALKAVKTRKKHGL